MTMYYLTLGSIFVTSSGARKDNVLSYFVVNLCNALWCKERQCMILLWAQSL